MYFNPQYFQLGGPGHLTYPLQSTDFESNMVSPVVVSDPSLIELDPPVMPHEQGFGAEVEELLKLNKDVAAGAWPNWFFENHGIDLRLPKPFVMEFSRVDEPHLINAALNFITYDKPLDLGMVILRWLGANQLLIFKRTDISHDDFLGGEVLLLRDLAECVHAALHSAFEHKYFFGKPRPEEVLGFQPGRRTPRHPADPAGHGAVAGSTYAVFDHHLELSDSVVEMTCRQACMWRSLIMVHYAQDNLRGFELGKETARRILARKR